MKKQFFCVSLLLMSTIFLPAQTKTKKSMTGIEKKVAEMSFPYQKINDSLVVIPFKSTHLSAFNIVFARSGALYILYVNLSDALPGKLDANKYQYLLQQNNDIDFVKIGLDKESGKCFLRTDVLVDGASTNNLKKLLNQMGDAADLIATDLN
jgi:hypothetical protein